MPTDDKTPEQRMREAFRDDKPQPSFNWSRVLEVLKPGPGLGEQINDQAKRIRKPR